VIIKIRQPNKDRAGHKALGIILRKERDLRVMMAITVARVHTVLTTTGPNKNKHMIETLITKIIINLKHLIQIVNMRKLLEMANM
jgi:hypothetical protein